MLLLLQRSVHAVLSRTASVVGVVVVVLGYRLRRVYWELGDLVSGRVDAFLLTLARRPRPVVHLVTVLQIVAVVAAVAVRVPVVVLLLCRVEHVVADVSICRRQALVARDTIGEIVHGVEVKRCFACARR
jgi:hypothetical protein